MTSKQEWMTGKMSEMVKKTGKTDRSLQKTHGEIKMAKHIVEKNWHSKSLTSF